MNYYSFHIGDFNNATRHLTRVERSLYRDLIDVYYDTEHALNGSDFDRLAKRVLANSDEEKKALKGVLDEFFTLCDDHYHNERCDKEIAKYRANTESKRKAGKASATSRQQKLTPVEHVLNKCATNQEPRTKNQEPSTKSKPKTSAEYPEEFEQVWDKYPSRPGASKKDSFKAWKARVSDGVDPDVMLGGVIRYAAYCRANGTEPQFVKQPTTFFGPGEHYLSDWNIPAARASPAYKNIHDQRAETYAILTGKTKNERPNTDERVITGEAVRIA